MRCPLKMKSRRWMRTTTNFTTIPKVTKDRGATPSTAFPILLSRSISRTVKTAIPETLKRSNPLYMQIVRTHFVCHVVHDLPSGEGADTTSMNGSASGPSVPLLYQRFREVRPLLKGFLFQLHHVSECTGPCSYPWCSSLKRDLHHASICTDMQCKLCSVLRLLLLLHSRCCNRPQCPLPFCLVRLLAPPHSQHYRTAWSTFIMCMNGCPAPDFADVLGLDDLLERPAMEDVSASALKSASSTPIPISPTSDAPHSAVGSAAPAHSRSRFPTRRWSPRPSISAPPPSPRCSRSRSRSRPSPPCSRRD